MKSLFTALCLTGLATVAHADWNLNQADSSFSFSSIKKNHAYEAHTFNKYEGSISDAGKAVLTLDLGSVNTGIEIRDTRMKEMLFNVVKFPSAQYEVDIDPAVITGLKVGGRTQVKVDGKLVVFNEGKSLPATLNVFKLSDTRVLVSTAKPITVKASDFGLEAGVEALRKVANLPVISLSVPVNFSLVFDQK